MPANSNHGITTMKRHEDYFLRDGNICFLVENTLFRVHRYFFERESRCFNERLAPSGEGEDGSPDSPYRIHDIKVDEFADFVWVFYNPRYSYSDQPKQKWLTILRLATMWQFGEVRQLAIRHLEKIKFDAIEKISTYKHYAVDNALLLPSYITLCTSPKLPSPAEGKILSMETVLRLATARERVLLRASEQGCKTPTVASAPEDIIKTVVAELFELTIHPNEQHVGVDSQLPNNSTAGGNSASTEACNARSPVPPVKKTAVNGTSQGTPQPATNGVTGKSKQK